MASPASLEGESSLQDIYSPHPLEPSQMTTSRAWSGKTDASSDNVSLPVMGRSGTSHSPPGWTPPFSRPGFKTCFLTCSYLMSISHLSHDLISWFPVLCISLCRDHGVNSMCGCRKLVSTRPKRLSLFMSPLCFSTGCCTLPLLITYLLRNEWTKGSFWKSHVVCSVESGAFIPHAQCWRYHHHNVGKVPRNTDDTYQNMYPVYFPPLASQSTIIGTSMLCTQGCAPEKSLDTCELDPVITAHVERAYISE